MGDAVQVVREKLAKSEAKLAAGEGINISGIISGNVRKMKAPKGDKGRFKQVGNTHYYSDNYDAVAAAEADGLIPRGSKAAFAAKYGRGEQVKTPGQVKETGRRRDLIEAVANAEANGKLVDVSNLHVAVKGSGDKAHEVVQGYRTINPHKEGYTGAIVGVAAKPEIVSNNYDAYRLAVEELGLGYLAQQYYDQYPNQRGGKPEKRSPRVKVEGAAGAKSPGRNATPEEKLMFQYNKAANPDPVKFPYGAYLDVSQLKSDGTGSKLVKKTAHPKEQLTRVRGGDEQILISNNYESYKMATNLLGPEWAPFAADFLRVHGRGRLEREVKEKAVKTKAVKGALRYQRSASRSPSRSPRRVSPARGRSASPSNLVRRLSQERSASRGREALLQQELNEEREVERSLEQSLARARSASRSASRSPARSPVRQASPARSPRTTATAPRITVPRRGLVQPTRTTQGF